MAERTLKEQKRISEAWRRFLMKAINEGENGGADYQWLAGLYYLDTELTEGSHFQLKQRASGDNSRKGKKLQNVVNNTIPDWEELPAMKLAAEELEKELGNPERINEIDFSGLDFEEDIDFSWFIFPVKVSFKDTTFFKSVNFNRTKFYGLTHFTGTQFNGIYKDNIEFRGAEFFGSVDFIQAKLHSKGNFQSVQFSKGGNFTATKFYNAASFNSAKFNSGANFQNAEFFSDEPVEFKKTKFLSGAFFQDTKFSCHLVNFNYAEFPSSAFFNGTEFYNYVAFQNVEFTEHMNFTNAKFEKRVPLFYGAKLYPDIIWDRRIERWPITKKHTDDTSNKEHIARITSNQNAYEHLAYHMKRLDKYHDEHFFFRQEMRCRRKLGGFFNWLVYGLYELLSDYGYGVGRAFIAWSLHIVFGVIAIMITAFCAGMGLQENLFCSVSVSVANANPYVFLGVNEGSLMNCYDRLNELSPMIFGAIRGIQTIFGIAFLFLLLLTLRVRFRL